LELPLDRGWGGAGVGAYRPRGSAGRGGPAGCRPRSPGLALRTFCLRL